VGRTLWLLEEYRSVTRGYAQSCAQADWRALRPAHRARFLELVDGSGYNPHAVRLALWKDAAGRIWGLHRAGFARRARRVNA
jgi:hypothetical protein